MTRKKALPKSEEKLVVAKYEPNPTEQKALAEFRAKRESLLPSPEVKFDEKNKLTIDHPHLGTGWALMMHSMGTDSLPFANGLFNQLVSATAQRKDANLSAINFALSVIDGIKPQDQLETMLAAQMAVVHMEVMRFARKLTHIETLNQQNSNERALNKLMRTFMDQMTALRKHRTGGKQEVTVHHVTVNQGGQAIVGNVQQAKGEGEG